MYLLTKTRHWFNTWIFKKSYSAFHLIANLIIIDKVAVNELTNRGQYGPAHLMQLGLTQKLGSLLFIGLIY